MNGNTYPDTDSNTDTLRKECSQMTQLYSIVTSRQWKKKLYGTGFYARSAGSKTFLIA